ncbi:MAG: hypothetical protein SFU99_01920 [Saprospiraceae bacterium]|nr:hypothetical protein [Saprospiraceae bacterium]
MKTHFILLLFVTVLFLYSCGNQQSKSDNTAATQEETPATSTESQDLQALTGIYEFGNEASTGTLNIEYKGNNQIVFLLSVGTASGCTGEIDGEATLGENKTATFSTENCASITFTFIENAVDVAEQGCDFFHGMRCGFGGKYSKKI